MQNVLSFAPSVQRSTIARRDGLSLDKVVTDTMAELFAGDGRWQPMPEAASKPWLS
jgi:hypothetical protein